MIFFAAVDLGASSGRIAVGSLQDGKIVYEVVHRFPNHLVTSESGSLLWDWPQLVDDVISGLQTAATKFKIASIGVDTWAVDYLLLDSSGIPSAPVYAYRDSRTDGVMEQVIEKFGKSEIYENSGIQFLPFNTVYQLLAAEKAKELSNGSKFLMLPDAINFLLCGSTTNEITNASTTQLLNPETRTWAWELIDRMQLPRSIFPELHEARSILGEIDGIPNLIGSKVVAVGSHDTASAVAGTPMLDPDSTIYISSGTWSLVGCELQSPIASVEAMNANLTNELGVDGTVRLLKNVAGMWIISQLLQEWEDQGEHISVEDLVLLAVDAKDPSTLINPNDPTFLLPGPMELRIRNLVTENGGSMPTTKGEMGRLVFASLAKSYLQVINEIESVTGKRFESIHIVGGGSANRLLNQLTADITGKTVVAGPIEATLMGNIGMQAMAAGVIRDLVELRSIVAKSASLAVFNPCDSL